MKSKLTTGTIMAATCILLTAAPGPAAASLADYTWDIIDLNMLNATGINNAGRISGYSSTHALLWSNGTTTDLHPTGDQYRYSTATDINNMGNVVMNVTASQYMDPVPFVWSQGTLTQLGRYGIGAVGYAINDAGVVVGFNIAQDIAAMWGAQYPSFQPRVISEAYDINNVGQVVGSDRSSFGMPSYGTIWDQTSVTTLTQLEAAFAINDVGQVVGITKEGRAALWDNGSLTDIGPSSRYTADYSINNKGEAVGMMDGSRSYVWDNGAVIDLATFAAGTGWTLTSANDINDNSQIVGTGVTPDGRSSSSLLTPSSKLAPTPIPAIVPLLLTGLSALGFWTKFKDKG